MYRKYRTGALVLAIVQLLGMIGLVYVPLKNHQVPDVVAVSTVFGMVFWLAVSFGAHARLKHVESIKFSRSLE